MKESNIQSLIIKEITKHGGYCVNVIKSSRSGTPDLLACIDGHFIGIEVKKPSTKNNLSHLQIANLGMIRKSGGLAITCSSLLEFREKLLGLI